MDKVCENSESPLSLCDLARIALGHGKGSEDMSQTQIIVLYSLIMAILKKLNCENEIVTITGVKSKQLRDLLQKSYRSVLPCDEKLKVLTEKLSKLSALEKQVEKMEVDLEKHLSFTGEVFDEESPLNLKYNTMMKNRTTINEYLEQKEQKRFSTKFSRLRFSDFNQDFQSWLDFSRKSLIRFASQLSHQSSKSTATRKSDFGSYRSVLSTTNVPIESPIPLKTHFSNSSDSSHFIFMPKRISGAGFQEFREHIENTDGWFEAFEKMKKDCDKESDSPSTLPRRIVESVVNIHTFQIKQDVSTQGSETTFNSGCYQPCEDIFTIPDPANDIPKHLLSSSFFVKFINANIAWPLKRRVRNIDWRVQELSSNLLECIAEWETLMKKYENIEAIEDEIGELGFKIPKCKEMHRTTLLGMQNLFDRKVDKADMAAMKEEILEAIEEVENSVSQVKTQLKCSRSLAFIYQTKQEQCIIQSKDSEGKKQAIRNSEENTCHTTTPPSHEPTLLQRINRLTGRDLEYLRERQSRHAKTIRLTGSAAEHWLKNVFQKEA